MSGSGGDHAVLEPPVSDDAQLAACLGAKGYHDDVPLSQYPAWAEYSGLTGVLAGTDQANMAQIVSTTQLTEAGAEALLGVLATLGLVERDAQGVRLTRLARDYLDPASPYYLGASLYLNCRRKLPNAFVKAGSPLAEFSDRWPARAWRQWRKRRRGWDWGGARILENQHTRNLPAGVAAAALPLFHQARCVVDMAGGTGTFSIPLAQRYPDTRIVLTDLPQSLDGARRYLDRHGLAERIELLGMDVFGPAWPIPRCDVLFFGNFVHGFSDERCRMMAERSFDALEPGGLVVWHELCWNERRDGPLKAALFHVTMQGIGGHQRTVHALHEMLAAAGFENLFDVPTRGGFRAVGGRRPANAPAG